MSETYTPTENETENSMPKSEPDLFNDIQDLQKNQANQLNEPVFGAEAARKAAGLKDAQTPAQPPATTESSGWSTREKLATVIVAGATAIGGGLVAADQILPGQEIASASSTINQGEGITDAVDRSIDQIEAQKVDPADIIERADVISQAVDIHRDENGVVHPGQTVGVIAEKSPIFNNVTYKAAPVVEAAADTPQQPATTETIPTPETH